MCFERLRPGHAETCDARERAPSPIWQRRVRKPVHRRARAAPGPSWTRRRPGRRVGFAFVVSASFSQSRGYTNTGLNWHIRAWLHKGRLAKRLDRAGARCPRRRESRTQPPILERAWWGAGPTMRPLLRGGGRAWLACLSQVLDRPPIEKRGGWWRVRAYRSPPARRPMARAGGRQAEKRLLRCLSVWLVVEGEPVEVGWRAVAVEVDRRLCALVDDERVAVERDERG